MKNSLTFTDLLKQPVNDNIDNWIEMIPSLNRERYVIAFCKLMNVTNPKLRRELNDSLFFEESTFVAACRNDKGFTTSKRYGKYGVIPLGRAIEHFNFKSLLTASHSECLPSLVYSLMGTTTGDDSKVLELGSQAKANLRNVLALGQYVHKFGSQPIANQADRLLNQLKVRKSND